MQDMDGQVLAARQDHLRKQLAETGWVVRSITARPYTLLAGKDCVLGKWPIVPMGRAEVLRLHETLL